MDLAEACPGLITDTAGEALRAVLQSSHLLNNDAQTVGAAAMGRALEQAYRQGLKGREPAGPVCNVTGIVGGGQRAGEIGVTAPGLKDGAPGAEQTGVRVTRADKERSVTFDCVSTRVGSTRDAPLRITGFFKDQFHDSEGDAVLGEDYLVLAHSAAFAIAKELGCEKNGGLPDGALALPRPDSSL
ncbi:hypothetical protein ACFCV9_19875 [Streptomyces sp. NPDC056367]|uniref:hypothetical protein n=1 Tax=unclassified Streptomyces TaxID=2593676 RepID=UPI0035E1AAD5